MKTYKYNVGGREFSLTLNAAGQIVAADGAEPTNEQMAHYAAVISLALAEDAATIVHDDETATSVTITSKSTPWNNPQRQFNTLRKEAKV